MNSEAEGEDGDGAWFEQTKRRFPEDRPGPAAVGTAAEPGVLFAGFTHLQPDVLLDEVEAGRFLRLSPRTMQQWRVKGDGPRFVRLSARCIRYRVQDLRDFVTQSLRTSTSDPGPSAAG